MSNLSRADLLYLLQRTPDTLQTELGSLLGFEYRPASETKITFPRQAKKRDANEEPPVIEKEQQRAQVQYPAWYINRYHIRHTKPAKKRRRLQKKRAKRQPQPLSEPLFSQAQLQVLWDRCLAQQQLSKQPDIPGAVKVLSKAQPVVQLPKLKRESSNKETFLFLDRSNYLQPIWNDQLFLAGVVRLMLGVENCQVILMMEGISGSFRVYGRKDQKDWRMELLPETARLVFFSDLGVHSPFRQLQTEWRGYLRELGQMGHQVVVLNPCNRIQTFEGAQQFSLDSGPSRFPILQSAIVACLQAKLPRVRQLRQQITGGNLNDELELWNHTDRCRQATGMEWRLNPEFLYHWTMKANLDEWQQQSLQELNDKWRTSQAAETEAMEQLLEQMLCDETIEVDTTLLDPVLDRLEADPFGIIGERYWLQSQQQLLRFFRIRLRQKAEWNRLVRLLDTLEPDDDEDGNNEVSKVQINLAQFNNALLCTAETDSAAILLQTRGPILDVCTGRQVEVGMRYHTGPVQLRSLEAEIELNTINKPNWAERFWLEQDGYYAVHPEQALFHLQPASPERQKAQWLCRHNPWPWASEAGIDDFGVWVDMKVEGIVLKLRWIPPGQFLMGSPESEPERLDDEILHTVTLAQGYWLGEISCTQALWRAVMENGPSDDSRPGLSVVEVSWEEVQEFCSQLNRMVSGFHARLPTEAEWEYACRAGSRTAFWWGDEWLNEYGNNGFELEQENRYPANPFGLKSMSGNVWEWCYDRYGEYPKVDVTDPAGPEQGRGRVLRGGSWDRSGRFLRSARRYANLPDFRSGNIGFRLAGGFDPQASLPVFTACRGPWNGQAVSGKKPAEKK